MHWNNLYLISESYIEDFRIAHRAAYLEVPLIHQLRLFPDRFLLHRHEVLERERLDCKATCKVSFSARHCACWSSPPYYYCADTVTGHGVATS
eukprot:1277719-Rhodomonas_salina.2